MLEVNQVPDDIACVLAAAGQEVADTILDRAWGAVGSVARRLVEVNSLTGQEVRELVDVTGVSDRRESVAV